MRTPFIPCQTSLPDAASINPGTNCLAKNPFAKKLSLVLNETNDSTIDDSVFTLYGWDEGLSDWVMIIKWQIQAEPTPLSLPIFQYVETTYPLYTCTIVTNAGDVVEFALSWE